MRKIGKITPVSLNFGSKKPFFSDKEIIFRGSGRAKVFTISSKMQVLFLIFVVFVSVWSLYYYHMYSRSGHIISKKNIELVATRDAYVDLMGDFVALQNSITDMLDKLGSKEGDNAKESDFSQYKQHAAVIEEKVKKITDQVGWINAEKLEEKANINEVALQRDIAISERDDLHKQLLAMHDLVEDIKKAEKEILERVAKIVDKESAKIKSAVASINVPLKKRSMYFNVMANDKRKRGSGGPYIPVDNKYLKDKEVNNKVNKIFQGLDDIEYSKEVMQYVPIGKPVRSYWISSKYGARNDPFKKTKAYHKGLDFAGREGNKIRVQAKGKVIRSEYTSGYGNLVVVDHENGFKTKYAHLRKSYVKKGDYLDIGDEIGELGNTGRSTGPHLHYEILYHDKDVDPMPFVKAKIS